MKKETMAIKNLVSANTCPNCPKVLVETPQCNYTVVCAMHGTQLEPRAVYLVLTGTCPSCGEKVINRMDIGQLTQEFERVGKAAALKGIEEGDAIVGEDLSIVKRINLPTAIEN